MTEISHSADNIVAAFQIEGWPVRGRIVRLGASVHEILTRHDYPQPVANLLGEACALAALVGSSLKFALVACGEADVYPRSGPTMEWDTAAGDAVLRAAGGRVLTDLGQPLLYGKADKGFENSGFIAFGG